MPTIRIEVTQEDIKDGVRGDCYTCPLARAIGRAMDLPGSAFVTLRSLYLDDFTRICWLPVAAAEFVTKFDLAKSAAEPFSFDLEVPAEFLPNPTPCEA